MPTTRRLFLSATALSAAAAAMLGSPSSRATETFAVTRTDAEWRSRLSSPAYAVLRRSGTEMPYSSPLNAEHRSGTFACAGCDRPLFASDTKFDSGTGWPSFWAVLDGATGSERDSTFGMNRTAVHCGGCGGHLGHLFPDGPKPTGLRFCMNGVAMAFTPAAAGAASTPLPVP